MNNYLIIDNWYKKEELKRVMKELDYLSCTPMSRSENSFETARNSDNKSLSSSFRIYPEQLYTEKGYINSPILGSLKKFQQQEFHQKVTDAFKSSNTAIDRVFMDTNASSTIINYYETNDRYDEHHDVFQFTILIWVYKEPKSFEGGDLIFTKLNEKIECKNNRMVLFPSFYYHAVTPVKMKTSNVGFGRYAITHFFFRKF